MKTPLINIYILLLSLTYPVSLQEMYDNASSYLEYDKYIELDGNEVYTGGIGIYEGNVYINGNGSIIDLSAVTEH